MIMIKKTGDLSDVDVRALKEDAQKLLRVLGYDDFDLGIKLTTNEEIRSYNNQFRGVDRPTDVLSFPYHIDLVAGERIVPQSNDDKNLGDIFISVEYLRKVTDDFETQTLAECLRIMLVHGLCHLLGYTHDEEDDYEVMQQKEDEFLALLRA